MAVVNLRNKLILVFAALALAPLALVCLLQYRAGAAAAETLLRERADERVTRLSGDVHQVLSVQQARLLRGAFERVAAHGLSAREG